MGRQFWILDLGRFDSVSGLKPQILKLANIGLITAQIELQELLSFLYHYGLT
jgi:hypothetical protein